MGAYDVKYMPQTAIKGQVLANFVTKFIESMIDEEEKAVEVVITLAIVILPWEVYTDEVANWKGVGIGIVLITFEKLIMEKSLWLGFLATNNEVEYEALLAGVAMVR